MNNLLDKLPPSFVITLTMMSLTIVVIMLAIGYSASNWIYLLLCAILVAGWLSALKSIYDESELRTELKKQQELAWRFKRMLDMTEEDERRSHND
jgi:H+/Cl- antiporter ClcA